MFEEAGVPKGVLNVITCSRDSVAEVGDEMIEHPYVKGISFTGSTAVGDILRWWAEEICAGDGSSYNFV